VKNVSNLRVNKFILIVVTLSYSLTWIPGQVFGAAGEKLSLIRIFGVPFIIISFILEGKSYRNVLRNPLILFFILSTLIGMGLGFFLGRLSISTIVSFFPGVLALMFYARRMDYYQIKIIIFSLLLGSISVCVISILAYLGIIAPIENVEIEMTNLGIIYKRTWAGLTSSHIGPWVILLLCYSVIHGLFKTKSLILSAVGVFIAFLTSFYTGQRSTMFSLIVAFLLCVGLCYSHIKLHSGPIIGKIYYKNFLINTMLILLIFFVLYSATKPDIATIKYRISNMFVEENRYGSEDRLLMWKYFVIDLIKNPTLVGTEDIRMEEKVGAGTHLFLGESFYYGGILLLASTVMISASSIKYLLSTLKGTLPNMGSEIILIIASTLIATFIYLTVMPGLFSRLPYILIGIAQGLNSRNRCFLGNKSSSLSIKR